MSQQPDPSDYGDVYLLGKRFDSVVVLPKRRTKRGQVLSVTTDAGTEMEIHVSPKGTKLRAVCVRRAEG